MDEERNASVRRGRGRVWIEGVPDRPVGFHWDALLRGLQIILEHRGDGATLNELMAYSGDAFNLCHGSNWQGVAYLCIPTNPVANVANAYGYDYTCLHNGYGRERMDRLSVAERRQLTGELLDRIWAEIDAGRPALVGGCNDGSCGDWSVVAGYDRENMMMSHIGIGKACRWIGVRGFSANPDFEEDRQRGVEGFWNGRFRGTIRENFVGGWQCNPAFLLGRKIDRPRAKQSAAAALKRAVELHRAPMHHIGWWGGVDYCFGRQAYEKWAEELRDLDYPADLGKQLPDGAYDWYEMGNMDTQAGQILRGRAAAADFCEKSAELLPGAKNHLHDAARSYRTEAEIARTALGVFLPAHDGNDAPRRAWLSHNASRQEGARAIHEMLKEERAAVAEIEKALANAG